MNLDIFDLNHLQFQPTPHYPSYIPKQGQVIYNYKNHTLDLKNTSVWPAASSMKLNESQVSVFIFRILVNLSITFVPGGGTETCNYQTVFNNSGI